MVAGGDVSTAETLLKDGGTAWQYIANLPYQARLSGIGIDGHFFAISKALFNHLFLLHYLYYAGGKDNTGYRTEVLQYDDETNQWITVGHLSKGRRYHAVGLVPKSIGDYCVD